MTRSVFVFLGIALLCAACGSDNTSTTTTSPTPAGPGTQLMNAIMAPQGTAMRTFTASASGTVTVTLTSTSPATVVGLGIGIPGSAAGGCDMVTTVNTAGGASPQLSVAVDAGDFCAGAFDRGTVGSSGVLVSITIVHP